MAAKSVTIDNTLEAIKNGTIKGLFSSDNKEFIFPTIEYSNKRGDKLEWIIKIILKKNDKIVQMNDKMLDNPVDKLDENYTAEILVISYQVGGKVRKTVPTVVKSGKNIGKKNETNVLTQAFRDALGLYNKKSNNTDITKKPPPMLLQWYNDSKTAVLDFNQGITIQKKYNGVRYVTYLENNKIIQYSRTGSNYYPASNISNELIELLNVNNLPVMKIGKYGIQTEDELNIYLKSQPYIDGELYMHGKSLNYISGQARKEKDKDILEYYIFDVFFPEAISNGYNMISKYRQEYLDDMIINKLQFVHKVQNYKVSSFDELNALTESFIKDGFEGAIARKDDKGYEYSYNNYHSSNIIKIKPVYSDEFNVVGFTEGKKGKDVGKIIWICEIPNPKKPKDNTFTVVPNLTLEQREKLYKCLIENDKIFPNKIKGLPMTIEYSELSEKTGKPLQAKAVAFRTYESSNDPIKKIYKECGL